MPGFVSICIFGCYISNYEKTKDIFIYNFINFNFFVRK